LFTLERIVEMKQAIALVANVSGEGHPLHITDDEWLIISDMIHILKPFQIITDKVQSNNATLLDVYISFNTILEYCASEKTYHKIEFSNIDWNSDNNNSVRKIIESRYLNNTNMAAIKTIHILSMSKDRQLLQQIEPSSVKEEIIKILTNILVTTRSNASTINAETSVDMERAIANAVMQLVNFKLYTGRFVRTVEEQLNWNNSQFDLKRYWVDRLDHNDTYELALVAIGLLSVNPSEASVERSFSAQKLIHSNLRNRLCSDSVIGSMFIKINTPLLYNCNSVWLNEMITDKYEDDNEVIEVPID
jgi:hypothetical protein